MNKTTAVQTPYCPYCGQSYYVVKAGLNDTGSQRMRCQQCRRYFTPNPKPMGYDQSTKEMAVRLYLEGMSFRGIGKVLSVHYLSVINWVNAHEAQLPQQVTDREVSGIRARNLPFEAEDSQSSLKRCFCTSLRGGQSILQGDEALPEHAALFRQ
jgi:transposase-like protein